MRYALVNGINTHGKNNVDLLGRDLLEEGLQVQDIRLPRVNWFRARWVSHRDGETIAASTHNGDVLIAHSFGAVRAWNAHNLRDYKAIFLIAPAQSCKVKWKHPNRVFCFHSKADWVVKLGSALAFHPFGTAGLRGYWQDGITNVDMTGYGADHNDYFTSRLRKIIMTYIRETYEQ